MRTDSNQNDSVEDDEKDSDVNVDELEACFHSTLSASPVLCIRK